MGQHFRFCHLTYVVREFARPTNLWLAVDEITVEDALVSSHYEGD